MTAKEKTVIEQIDSHARKNGGFDFQSRRFFALTQTHDDLQRHGS